MLPIKTSSTRKLPTFTSRRMTELVAGVSLAVLAVGVPVQPASAATGDISTIAGNGTVGYTGDGGPASSATLSFPQAVALDPAGDVYFVDRGNHVIRLINRSAASITAYGVTVAPGNIGTVAGNGTIGYSGDGGPATSAALGNRPQGVTRDVSGNLYIADTSNNVIRKVTPAGIISTFAGNGTAGFSGDGGPATAAAFNFPAGVSVDGAGNLYVADFSNQRVRRIDPTGTITTFAGNGTNGATGDGGPAASAELSSPIGVTVSGSQLYIVDQSSGRIRLVNLGSTTITLFGISVDPGNIATVAGGGTRVLPDIGEGGPATAARIDSPFQVAVAPGPTLFISSQVFSRIFKVTPDDTFTTVAGASTPGGLGGYGGDGGPATQALLNGPRGVGVDHAGNIIITDSGNQRVRLVQAAAARRQAPPADFDGNGTTDVSVFRPATGDWFSQSGTATNFGTSGDIPVPGDYNGDGTTDIAVFRPSTGVWYVNGGTSVAFGTSGDIPVPGDYNGDGTTDIAVFRPSTGVWYVNGGTSVTFGTSGDIPLPLPAAIRSATSP